MYIYIYIYICIYIYIYIYIYLCNCSISQAGEKLCYKLLSWYKSKFLKYTHHAYTDYLTVCYLLLHRVQAMLCYAHAMMEMSPSLRTLLVELVLASNQVAYITYSPLEDHSSNTL